MSRLGGETIPTFAMKRAVYQVSECRLVHCANQTHTKSIPTTAFVSNLTSVQGTGARRAKRYWCGRCRCVQHLLVSDSSSAGSLRPLPPATAREAPVLQAP